MYAADRQDALAPDVQRDMTGWRAGEGGRDEGVGGEFVAIEAGVHVHAEESAAGIHSQKYTAHIHKYVHT